MLQHAAHMVNTLFRNSTVLYTLSFWRIIRPASSCETEQLLEFPLNGLQAQSRVSPVVELLPLASGQAYFGIGFSQFLMKLLYRSDWFVIASFVGTVYHEKLRVPVGWQRL